MNNKISKKVVILGYGSIGKKTLQNFKKKYHQNIFIFLLLKN